MGGAGGGAAAAAAAAIAQAIKASGAIVKMEPEQFQKLLSKSKEPAVVMAHHGWPTKKFHYMMSYKGLFFYTKSVDVMMLPSGTDLITAEKIWIPG